MYDLQVLGDLIMALKIIPTQPSATATASSEALDNSVSRNNHSEEDKENNPLMGTTSHVPSSIQNPTLVEEASTEPHSNASTISIHETEQCSDKASDSQGIVGEISQSLKSDSIGVPMEGVEEGSCNGNDSANAASIGTTDNLVTAISANSQVDMSMSDNEYSERD